MGIPENLKRLREREGLSQTELASLAKVSQQLISQLERGENLTTKKLPQIARSLGASVDDVDPNFRAAADDDGLRQRLIDLFDSLPEDLQPVALRQVEALGGLRRQARAPGPPKKAGQRRE